MRTTVVILRNPNLSVTAFIENFSFFPVVSLHIFFTKKPGCIKANPA